jgi:hypothetical protein
VARIGVPFAAPSTGAFVEISPLGVRQGCRTSAEGQEPLLLTLDKSEERRKQAATGRLFFGYFLLAKQKKVTRLRVRGTRFKQASRQRLLKSQRNASQTAFLKIA